MESSLGQSGHKRDGATLTVIVNGVTTLVEINDDAPLRVVLAKALEQTHNTGQPPENWELRDVAGTLLDLDRKIEDYDFDEDTRLFLNPRAGVGGGA